MGCEKSWTPHFSILVLALLFSVLKLGNCFEEYEKVGLNVHNAYRAQHQSPPLTLDESMNEIAQGCAELYARKQALDFSCKQARPFGQNLAQTWAVSKTKPVAVKEAIKMWYDGYKHHDKNNPVFSTKSGGFTQIVWKSTKTLGLGVAKSGSGKEYYVVALYSPPGNVKGQFKENVSV